MWKTHFDRDGNFIQGEWIEKNEPPDNDYQPGDFQPGDCCPLCGQYTILVGGNYEDEPMHHECFDCGWTLPVDE